MSNLKRRMTAGLGAVALGGVLAGVGVAPASAADGFTDGVVNCTKGAVQVCAHVQYTTGDNAQVRAVGTAPDGKQVTITKVTLGKWYDGNKIPAPIYVTPLASTDKTVKDGGQLTAATNSVAREYQDWFPLFSYEAKVEYRINGGAVQTCYAEILA
ncbi:hypothetical protein ACIHFE_17380 [Streptomyces sp. NPDC052396]|uniref:hypothetical protein n=1 Tax=Streptomyces sp. NPDC052396 TaxID=3365689 RepID=UPI0037D0FA88